MYWVPFPLKSLPSVFQRSPARLCTSMSIVHIFSSGCNKHPVCKCTCLIRWLHGSSPPLRPLPPLWLLLLSFLCPPASLPWVQVDFLWWLLLFWDLQVYILCFLAVRDVVMGSSCYFRNNSALSPASLPGLPHSNLQLQLLLYAVRISELFPQPTVLGSSRLLPSCLQGHLH